MKDKKRIVYKNGEVVIKDVLVYSGTDTEPSLYPLETLQGLWGMTEGLKQYVEQNKRSKIFSVEYID